MNRFPGVFPLSGVVFLSVFASSREAATGEVRKQKGFSLIELLIVVAIILIIAAIAIPNLMRARMAANDSSAAASEHTIVVGEVGYRDSCLEHDGHQVADDGVIRTEPAGTITVAGGYSTCLGRTPINN